MYFGPRLQIYEQEVQSEQIIANSISLKFLINNNFNPNSIK